VTDQAAQPPTQPVFRFAPSPNGLLHLGHALSALTDFDLCRRADGRFLLRIEDTDPTRCRPEYEAAIIEDLRWLGLSWEEPARRQSEHIADYRAAIDRLTGMGLVYPSFMSRGEIEAATGGAGWPRDPDGAPLYPGIDRDLDPAEAEVRIAGGAPRARRLRMDRAASIVGPLGWHEQGFGSVQTVAAAPAAFGDVLLVGRDRPASYNIAVVVDDAAQGVTHVVRGRDLYAATSLHVLLQKLLGLPSPIYHHHRLITDAAGRKLSKSDRDTSLRALREAGKTPADIRRMVGL
jgi:glutamyl-Q tRNA(Asp) synthetase